MQDFVNAVNSRKNRVTNLAKNKVTKKDVPRLVSLEAEQYLKLVRLPKLRLAKLDTSLGKSYEQGFTVEVFEVFDIPTPNSPTFNLIDTNREPIEGKFYESEQIGVLEEEEL